MTATETKRSLFIAHLVDGAVDFIKAHGDITISQLADHLAGAGVDVRGVDHLSGQELARYWGQEKFAALPVIATGSNQFLLIALALLVNRDVVLDSSNPTLAKLIWGGRWDVPRSKLRGDKTRTGGHYHILTVRDPGGPEQVAECWEGKCDLTFACQYLDELYLADMYRGAAIDEGWEAIWIVGCGPDCCRRDEIPNLPVEEWGEPYWGGEAVYAGTGDQDPYLVADYDTDELPPF
jgi:hypothetical protein